MKRSEASAFRAIWDMNEREGGEALALPSSSFQALVGASDILTLYNEAAKLRGFAVYLSAGTVLDHVGYQWFLTRFENFLFWERSVINTAVRRQGFGSELFRSLESKALARGHDLIVCHVHDRPPNPVGHLFVRRLGFQAIESVMLPSREIVTMYQRSIAIATP
jgi:predicted GNAT superfamily acetyltransferase